MHQLIHLILNTMNPKDFFNTIYLGDRACKEISIDFWNNVIRLKIDCIARTTPPVCQWGFNENNQIDDGNLVFSGVVSYEMNPQGIFANDYIYEYFIENVYNDETGVIYVFVFEMGYAKTISDGGSMTVKIEARDLWIEDPKIPGVRITE